MAGLGRSEMILGGDEEGGYGEDSSMEGNEVTK